MVNSDDDRRTVDYFSALVNEHGASVRAVDWGSEASQQLRFAVLTDALGSLHARSVLDVGCGTGALYGWLSARANIDYVGIDITPSMVETARSQFPAARFEAGTLSQLRSSIGRPDLVVASGIFFLRQHEPLAYMMEQARLMFDVATTAVAFNSLSAWSPDKDGNEFYADPAAVLEACRAITPWVRLRHDYHPRDFTVYLYKDRVTP